MKKILIKSGFIVLMTALFAACNGGMQPSIKTHTHQWGAWSVTRSATHTTEGEETRVCALDATHKETRALSRIPFTNISDLGTYLSTQSANTAYTVKLNVNSLGGDVNTSGSLGKILSDNSTKYVSLDLSGSTFSSIEDNAFNGCTNLTGIILPNGVTNIGASAFNRCTSLTSVNIPNSVTSIGIAAFQSCAGLTSITIPNSITSIAGSAFNRCTSLTSVTIPASVKSIGDWSFGNNTNLTGVTFQGTIPAADFNSMGSFFGDLRDKFYAANSTNGTPGTYTTTAPVSVSSVWTKQ